MQRLAQDATEVALLREEVTQAQVTAVKAKAMPPRLRGWPRKGLSCWLLPTRRLTRWLRGSPF
jgi:hypothetical protein